MSGKLPADLVQKIDRMVDEPLRAAGYTRRTSEGPLGAALAGRRLVAYESPGGIYVYCSEAIRRDRSMLGDPYLDVYFLPWFESPRDRAAYFRTLRTDASRKCCRAHGIDPITAKTLAARRMAIFDAIHYQRLCASFRRAPLARQRHVAFA